MKKDIFELLKHFDLNPKLKKGDLVLVAEVMRVVDPDLFKEGKDVEVITVFPDWCSACSPEGKECTHPHIMERNACGGQQVIMKLKETQ